MPEQMAKFADLGAARGSNLECEFESSRSSQAVRDLENFLLTPRKCPSLWAFCYAIGVSAHPFVALLGPEIPDVSAQYHENSHFVETRSGDRRIKPLRGVAVSLAASFQNP